MDTVDILKAAFGGAHGWYMGTVADVSSEDANHVPPGKAHPIGALMAHILHCEDIMVNAVVQGKSTLWEGAGWASKVGGPLLVDGQEAVARSYRCDTAVMGEYAQAVFANTDAFLTALTPAALDREINLKDVGFPENMTLGNFLTQALLGNTYAHTGEISTLKGQLGKSGYPF